MARRKSMARRLPVVDLEALKKSLKVDNYTYGYVRCSTQEQATKGLSVQFQQDAINRYFQYRQSTNPLPPWGGFFTDPGVRAKVPFMEREGGKALHERLQRGDHVIIWKVDRAFRNPVDCFKMSQLWNDALIRIHFMDIGVDTSTPTGEMLLGIMATLARWENRIRAERIREGKARAKLEGRHCNQRVGYGFLWIKGKIVPVPEELEAMLLIERYRDEDPPRGWFWIQQKFKADGIQCFTSDYCRRGKPATRKWQAWNYQRIQKAYAWYMANKDKGHLKAWLDKRGKQHEEQGADRRDAAGDPEGSQGGLHGRASGNGSGDDTGVGAGHSAGQGGSVPECGARAR
jgi:DNA invertase Pin-like site-specific DNA recombinase